MHGGTVEAHSDGPGRGSEFVVRLPVVKAVAQVATSQGDDGLSATANRRILVVDDNHDSAMSLGMMLKLMGNETHTAHDGLAAVEAAEKFRPDMILLDIGLPKLNGYDACRRIREQPWSKGHRDRRLDRMGPGRGSTTLPGGRLRPPSRQACRAYRPANPVG